MVVYGTRPFNVVSVPPALCTTTVGDRDSLPALPRRSPAPCKLFDFAVAGSVNWIGREKPRGTSSAIARAKRAPGSPLCSMEIAPKLDMAPCSVRSRSRSRPTTFVSCGAIATVVVASLLGDSPRIVVETDSIVHTLSRQMAMKSATRANACFLLESLHSSVRMRRLGREPKRRQAGTLQGVEQQRAGSSCR
jgi:hypothetical protein